MAAGAVRAGRGRRIGQDLGDGGARRLPGPGGERPAGRRRRRSRRPSRQRAVPDVHEQGDREPAAARPPGARAAGAGRGRGAGGRELPRVRGAAPGPLRHARGRRAGPAGPVPGAEDGALRARHGSDDVRARERRTAADRDRQHPDARRSGREPPAHARGDHRVQRAAAGTAEGAPLGPGVPVRGRADRAGARSGDLPSAQARPRGDRLRRPDLTGAPGGRGDIRRWPTSTASASAPCCWTSTRTPTSRRPR